MRGRRMFLKFSLMASFALLTGLTSSPLSVTVRATKYYAGHNCGHVTADGSRIVNHRVESGADRWVALSHDLFRMGFRLGDVIRVDSPHGRLNGVWHVKDKMGPRVRNGVDFLMTRGNSKWFERPCKVKLTRIGESKQKNKKKRVRRGKSTNQKMKKRC